MSAAETLLLRRFRARNVRSLFFLLKMRRRPRTRARFSPEKFKSGPDYTGR
jgi:hypothetical protein